MWLARGPSAMRSESVLDTLLEMPRNTLRNVLRQADLRCADFRASVAPIVDEFVRAGVPVL